MYNLQNLPEHLLEQYNNFRKEIPSILKAQNFTDNIINFLFPFKADRRCTLPLVELNLSQLQLDFKDLINPLEKTLDDSINNIAQKFFNKVPKIYESLMQDARLFLDFDPAARSIESVILYYPGFYCIAVYRLANVLFNLKIPFLPRMISEYAHSKTGIEIHPGATIGSHFFIDHGTGIVIGETTVIGNNVKIYQGVTLGAAYVKKSMKGIKRHPTIEDNVIIYSGTTILGGETVIGHDTIIGGNVWLTKSVPPYSVVYHESKVVIRDSQEFKKNEPNNSII
ncbi:MAG TPA: serine O-acetyltransferase EpsC [Bacteroidales bacterium]|nr:serine O-acetyltransferase EpsC [Bacteroidales bacterium]